MHRIFVYLRSIRRQFANYFITGISGTFLDIGLLYFFTAVLRIRPVIAVAINQLFVLGYVFLLNKYWTFRAQGFAHVQIARFFVVCAGNYALAIVWMWFFTEFFNFSDVLGDVYFLLEMYYTIMVRMLNIALSIGWNFLLYKYFVFKMSKVGI